jgi:hypothetical protein
MPAESESVTDFMVRVMEEFAEDEPEYAMLITITKEGWLKWRSNIQSDTMRIGMCEMVKVAITSSIERK